MTVNALANEAHNEGCQQLTEGERRVKGEVQVRAAGGPRLEVGFFLGGGGGSFSKEGGVEPRHTPHGMRIEQTTSGDECWMAVQKMLAL